MWNFWKFLLCSSERIVIILNVSKNYYYVKILEVVTYDNYTTDNIHFMDFKFKKYGK